jgi:putative acetyltransferase
MIWLRALSFILAVQVVVLGVVPIAIVSGADGPSLPIGALRHAGWLLLGAGLAMLAWCNYAFVVRGRGTAAPYDPPRELVVAGLYRFVRNPMYVSALLITLGEALVWRSAWLIGYTILLAVAYNIFVRFYEEPHLRRVFGDSYVRYCATVPRWIPRRPPTREPLEISPEPITSADATALIAALNRELSARYPEPGATHFRLDAEEVAPGAGVFLVVRWDGRPVGCGALRRLREDTLVRELGPRVGELKRMYVAPEMRGHAIGRALLGRLEGEARTLGLDRLVLETGTRQVEALALYRRAGYIGIPAYGEYSASTSTSVCMSKAL